MTVDLAPPKFRSVSQRNAYVKCPHAYYLERIEKAWQRPAAWLPMGSAVHYAVEQWEKSGRTMTVAEAQDAFRESYADEVGKYTAETPNLAWWFASGPYKAEDDIPRRYDLGLEHVERYVAWAEGHENEKVWNTPGGICQTHPWFDEDCETCSPELASELYFEVEFGGVPVRGYIDLVVEQDLPSGKDLVVRDVKTGNQPGDDFQLGVYARAVERNYNLPEGSIDAGDYMMTKTGKPTFPYRIDEWTNEKIGEEFAELEKGIAEGIFPPDPEPSKCKFCSVSYHCNYRQA